MKGSGTPTTGRMPLTMPCSQSVREKMTVMAWREASKVFDALMAIFIESTMRGGEKYIHEGRDSSQTELLRENRRRGKSLSCNFPEWGSRGRPVCLYPARLAENAAYERSLMIGA